MRNPRHSFSPTQEHSSLGGGFTPPGTEGPRQERCSLVAQALSAGSASTTPCRGTAASGRDSGFRGTVTAGGWNKVWTAVVGRAELGAGRGSRAVLFLRTFPSAFCAFGNVLGVSRRGREAAEGARPRPAGLWPGFRAHSRPGGRSATPREGASIPSFLGQRETLKVPCELVPVNGTVQSRKSPQGAAVATLLATLSYCGVGGKTVPLQVEE